MKDREILRRKINNIDAHDFLWYLIGRMHETYSYNDWIALIENSENKLLVKKDKKED